MTDFCLLSKTKIVPVVKQTQRNRGIHQTLSAWLQFTIAT